MQRDISENPNTLFRNAPQNVALEGILNLLTIVTQILPDYIKQTFVDDFSKTTDSNDLQLDYHEDFYNKVLQKVLQEKSREIIIQKELEKRLLLFQENIILDEEKIIDYSFEYQYIPYQKYLSPLIGKPHAVDIGVLISTEKNAFFTIECKRLRTKDNCKYSEQYVSGKTGGVKRFKENQHGQYTKDSAMVGYMEDESFDFWLEKVNGWIEAETKKDGLWSGSDKLIAKKIEVIIAEYVSEHKRKDRKDNIKLTHFWVKMN